jgi:hypothetical protein
MYLEVYYKGEDPQEIKHHALKGCEGTVMSIPVSTGSSVNELYVPAFFSLRKE